MISRYFSHEMHNFIFNAYIALIVPHCPFKTVGFDTYVRRKYTAMRSYEFDAIPRKLNETFHVGTQQKLW